MDIPQKIAISSHQRGAGIDIPMHIDKSRFPVHGIALREIVILGFRKTSSSILLREMDMPSRHLFQKVHARRRLFERFCHRLCGRRMKICPAPLLTQDIKADLVNISIEMRHVCNAGKIVRHILCHDAGDARTDTGRRQILKAF